MDRRHFIHISAAAACISLTDKQSFARMASLPEPPSPKGKARLKVAVMSDIHISTPESGTFFRKALEYYDKVGVDAVMIAGDMADDGLECQLQMVADIWNEVFPQGKGTTGRKVEKLFICGNHEIDGYRLPAAKKRWSAEELSKGRIVGRVKRVWERCFGEKYEPVFMKEVKGFKFIGAHYPVDPDEVEIFLRSTDIPDKAPFFYFQHRHPKGTCSAPWVWGQDDGRITSLLSEYPNAIAFSGHSHSSLTDERTLWQGAFTSVGTASMSFIVPFGGRENSKVVGSKEKVPAQMKTVNCRNGKQAQLMTVFDNCIVLEKRDFFNDESLAPEWVIPLPLTKRPLTFENRAADAVAPQFAKDSVVTLKRINGPDRYGVVKEQIVLQFPAAIHTKTSPRAFDYEVQVEYRDVDTVKTGLTKRVFSEAWHLCESQEKDVTCVFALDELPANREYRFAVRPVECFEKKGEPIYSSWQDAISITP